MFCCFLFVNTFSPLFAEAPLYLYV
uniref:Uncharacterized protein n=1 Tax=Anguilla anguilla TaxID=7936 RepID=A0A0E9WHX5_ANGAN